MPKRLRLKSGYQSAKGFGEPQFVHWERIQKRAREKADGEKAKQGKGAK
jgi:hypothetical protein